MYIVKRFNQYFIQTERVVGRGYRNIQLNWKGHGLPKKLYMWAKDCDDGIVKPFVVIRIKEYYDNIQR